LGGGSLFGRVAEHKGDKKKKDKKAGVNGLHRWGIIGEHIL
jgi:hypothetical protein